MTKLCNLRHVTVTQRVSELFVFFSTTTILNKISQWNLPLNRFSTQESIYLPLFVSMLFLRLMSLLSQHHLEKNIILGSDRGGVYKNNVNAPEGSKRRSRSSRRIGCPFKLYCKGLPDDKWQLKIQNPDHNHLIIWLMRIYPIIRLRVILLRSSIKGFRSLRNGIESPRHYSSAQGGGS